MLDPSAFVRENARLQRVPLLPEIALYLASEALPLWQHAQKVLARDDVPLPFWAFAWVGGQAVARYVIDHPEVVREKRVLDFAAGSGLVAIAAARACARVVTAADIDPVAQAAVALNAQANDVTVGVSGRNYVGDCDLPFDVVLAGDVCYEQPMASLVETWLRQLAERGTLVILGDPGRAYVPRAGLERLATYRVETTRDSGPSGADTSVFRF
jgi:predicted nicotinamide N-methyase